MNPVIHFGMPAEDRKRMAEFYAKVFGWQTKQFGPEMGNYILATTVESDEKGMPKKPGAINGGFFTKTEQDKTPKITIQVDDIEDAMRKVQAAGGTIIGGRKPGVPEDMLGFGKFVDIRGTEGNVVSRMEPARK